MELQRFLVNDNPTASPSPAALAFSTRLTPEQYCDVYLFARMIDEVAQEARDNERKRIFRMGFFELVREYWKGTKLHAS